MPWSKGITIKLGKYCFWSDEPLHHLLTPPFVFLSVSSDDLYTQLKDSLMERVKDKESAVRVQAVFALSKLQSGEEDEAENEDEENVVQVMIDLMQHDPSA